MVNEIQGQIKADNKCFAIIVARFNSFVTERLVEGAVDALLRHGAKKEDITIFRTPGAFEIPPLLKKIVAKNKYDGVICLGAVIRGGTPHFDYVASEVSKGVAQVSLDADIPIAFGVLTCDTTEQAIDRAGTKSGNKGFEAAMSLMEMVDLYNNI